VSATNTVEPGPSNIPIGFRKTDLTTIALLYLFLRIILTEEMKKTETKELEGAIDMVGLKEAYTRKSDSIVVGNDGSYWTHAAHISYD
jgi:hypothetical protein